MGDVLEPEVLILLTAFDEFLNLRIVHHRRRDRNGVHADAGLLDGCAMKTRAFTFDVGAADHRPPVAITRESDRGERRLPFRAAGTEAAEYQQCATRFNLFGSAAKMLADIVVQVAERVFVRLIDASIRDTAGTPHQCLARTHAQHLAHCGATPFVLRGIAKDERPHSSAACRNLIVASSSTLTSE